MKVILAVIFSLSYLSAISALPASRIEPEEVEFVPLEDQNRRPVIDTGVGPWAYNPWGVLDGFAAMMARLRQQMDYFLNRLPFRNGTIDESAFPGFPGIPDIDLSKGNTTSITKVIDGHKVVINETEYKSSGDDGAAFIKVRIIDVVSPDSSEMTTDKNSENITTPPQPQEPESLESSFENEIPKNRENEDFSSVETFDEPDNSQPLPKIANGKSTQPLESMEVESGLPSYTNQPFQKIAMGGPNWAYLEPFESVDDNFIDSGYRQPDLSRDTYVNQLMADAGAPTNPDAEVFSNAEYNVPYAGGRKPYFEKFVNPR